MLEFAALDTYGNPALSAAAGPEYALGTRYQTALNNRLIWRDYSYKNYDILAEPYFDINFNETLYLTDTGRKWNGNKVSVRDKVKAPFQQGFNFNRSREIIKAVDNNALPAKIMITTHPQRWHNNMGPWIKELILQNIKNAIKKYFYVANPMTE